MQVTYMGETFTCSRACRFTNPEDGLTYIDLLDASNNVIHSFVNSEESFDSKFALSGGAWTTCDENETLLTLSKGKNGRPRVVDADPRKINEIPKTYKDIERRTMFSWTVSSTPSQIATITLQRIDTNMIRISPNHFDTDHMLEIWVAKGALTKPATKVTNVTYDYSTNAVTFTTPFNISDGETLSVIMVW